MLEPDKCQEKSITGKVRCRGINCSPSWGDAQTDRLSERAHAAGTAPRAGGGLPPLVCVCSTASARAGWLHAARGVVWSPAQESWAHQEGKAQNSGTLSHAGFGAGGGWGPGQGAGDPGGEFTLLGSERLLRGVALTGRERRWGVLFPEAPSRLHLPE